MLETLVPTTSAASDRLFMAVALRLGRRMLGRVWPNPAVGCVIVRDGVIVGRGQTQPGGRPHAERVALDHAGAMASGATAFVTLEPCCHWGRTPPCAEAMIAAGIRRVVIAIEDPDPRVSGGGICRLRDAGIEVSLGVGAEAARLAHAGFFHRLMTSQPRLIVARRMPSWMDAELSSVDGALAGFVSDGRRRHQVRLRLTDLRPLALSRAPMDWADARGMLVTLGQLGLTNVAVRAGDPLVVLMGKGG
jgi:diaminohydroxyphosphoribosylaminopyrimidine deaminase/5-amino-6-(5-phosphoribosylamino)uracil reductase